MGMGIRKYIIIYLLHLCNVGFYTSAFTRFDCLAGYDLFFLYHIHILIPYHYLYYWFRDVTLA